jgi:hypothetical protein
MCCFLSFFFSRISGPKFGEIFSGIEKFSRRNWVHGVVLKNISAQGIGLWLCIFCGSYAVFADRICLSKLCERAFRSRLTLREEDQVELLGETPNGLSAVVTLPKAARQCQ